MQKTDADALAEVAALCAAARAKLPASGFRRLSVLLDMLLIDLGREVSRPEEAAPEDRPGDRPDAASASGRS